jgi:hypothetical protein
VLLLGAPANSVLARGAGDLARPQAGTAPRPRRLKKAEIKEAEQLLADLGYWTGPVDGRLDAISHEALICFQKVEGRERTGILNADELEAIRSASSPNPLDDSGAHIEIDIARQVLFVVNEDGAVTLVLPVSTGTGKYFSENGMSGWAYTPRGRQLVYKKLEGWHKSSLGLLYYPNYIAGGIAIHGSPSVPTGPASHGCIRIPIYASKRLAELTPVGTVVIVHEAGSFHYEPPWTE